ncbi:MAG: cation:proton antiporter, partial [Mycetocola sp.]
VFGAFFFLNFGLTLDPSQFPLVLWPVILAVLLTLVLNVVAGQFMARLYGFSTQAGINAAAILMNRGEFALILAILALTAGLDERLQPFAGLYVLVMSVMGPLLASNSEKIGAALLRTKTVAVTPRPRNVLLEEQIALVEAATSDASSADTARVVDRIVEQAGTPSEHAPEQTTKRDDDY